MPFTIPPPNKVALQGGFIADIDNTYAALSAVAGVNVLNAAYSGGADPTGVADSAAAIQAAVNALPAAGGVVYLPAGTYKTLSTITVTNPGVYFHGDTRWATIIKPAFTGDCIRMYWTGSYTPGTTQGGGLRRLMIDGTNAGAGSAGLHIGDIYNLDFDLNVRAFQGTGSKGVWFDNNYHWTEHVTGRIWAETCTTNVVFDNSANTSGVATGSFDRAMLDIFLDCKDKGNGVTFSGGALMVNSRLGIWGNIDSSADAAAPYAVLTITGQAPSSGPFSCIQSSILHVGVECNTSSHTLPVTVKFGTSGNIPSCNYIQNCTGLADFSGNLAMANAVNVTNNFEFDGPVLGDGLLQRTLGSGMAPFKTGTISNGATIATHYNSAVQVTNSGPVTGVILSGFNPNSGQLLTITNIGTGSITMAAAGTSHVAGGVSDVIYPATSAQYLWNVDNSLWYRVNGAPGPPSQELSLYLAPSGATAETQPRSLNGNYTAVLTSGQSYVSAIALPAGLVVSNLATLIGSTGFSGVTHGWFALLDSGRVVRAVTADQTSSFGTASTALSLAAGAAYTVPAAGLYYLMVCVAASTMGTLPLANTPLTGSATTAPILSGTSSSGQTTPPSTGTTMGAITAAGGFRFYGYTA